MVEELWALIAAVPNNERDETRLDEIEGRASALRDERGHFIAACGWDVWPGRIAHLRVLVHPNIAVLAAHS